MRYRALAITTLVLAAAPLLASCRRPTTTPPTTTPTDTLPEGRGRSCGTITDGRITASPAPAAGQPNQAPADCWGTYHVFSEVFITIVKSADGSTTRIQAVDHTVTVSRQVGTGPVRQCSGSSFAQVFVTNTGTYSGTCNPG